MECSNERAARAVRRSARCGLVALSLLCFTGCKGAAEPAAPGNPPTVTSSQSSVPADGVSTVTLTVANATAFPLAVSTGLGTLSTPDGQEGRFVALHQNGTVTLRSACDATTVAGCWGPAHVVAADANLLSGAVDVQLTCPGTTCMAKASAGGTTGSTSGGSGSGGGSGGGTGAGNYSIIGEVSGAANSGITLLLTGASTASTITPASGAYSFDGLASGAYTVTPSPTGDLFFMPASASVVVSNSSVGPLAFTAFPGTGPSCSVQISGDGSSGVGTNTYPCDRYSPPTDVAVYNPGGQWSVSVQFDAAGQTGLGCNLSGFGAPAVATFSGVGCWDVPCWTAQSVAGGGYDESWTGKSASVTFSSVGAAVPDVYSPSSVNYYSVHGTIHSVCLPSSIQGNKAVGTVTMDVTF